jgi:predicted transcriptional regulator
MKSTIARNEDIIWRKIEDKIVLIGKDGLEIQVLNKTAAHIWELCDGVNSPDEIAACLCEHFDVPPEEANADVREFINKLGRMGLLERRGETSES